MISRWRIVIALALAAAMVMVVAPAAAQQKIGVIDVQRILSDSLKGKAVVELLEMRTGRSCPSRWPTSTGSACRAAGSR